MSRKVKLTNRIYKSLNEEVEEEKIEVKKEGGVEKVTIPGLTKYVNGLKNKNFFVLKPFMFSLDYRTIYSDTDKTSCVINIKLKDLQSAVFRESYSDKKERLYLYFHADTNFEKYLVKSTDYVLFKDKDYIETDLDLDGYEFVEAICYNDMFAFVFREKK